MLIDDLLFWTAKIEEGLHYLLVVDVSHLFDLGEGEFRVVVEQHQDHCLVAVCHEGVRLTRDKHWSDFHGAVVQKPL